MNRKPRIASDFDKTEEDWTAYREFKDLWEIGSLTEASLVYRMVESSSLKICRVYDRKGEVMYVTNRCLSVLANAPFKRGTSLDGCIRTIINDEIISFWNFDSDVRADIAEMEEESRDLTILEEVFRRIETETYMRERVASKRELQEMIVDTVLSKAKPPIPPAATIRNSPTPNAANPRFVDRLRTMMLGKRR